MGNSQHPVIRLLHHHEYISTYKLARQDDCCWLQLLLVQYIWLFSWSKPDASCQCSSFGLFWANWHLYIEWNYFNIENRRFLMISNMIAVSKKRRGGLNISVSTGTFPTFNSMKTYKCREMGEITDNTQTKYCSWIPATSKVPNTVLQSRVSTPRIRNPPKFQLDEIPPTAPSVRLSRHHDFDCSRTIFWRISRPWDVRELSKT